MPKSRLASKKITKLPRQRYNHNPSSKPADGHQSSTDNRVTQTPPGRGNALSHRLHDLAGLSVDKVNFTIAPRDL